MFDSGVYCYELSEEQQRLFVRFEEVNPEYAARCAKRSEDMRALAHFFGCSDRDYEKHLNYKYLVEEGAGLVEDIEPVQHAGQTQSATHAPKCVDCDFYSGDTYLPCAVHPELKDSCSDFEVKRNNPPRKLEIQLPPQRKRFILAEFTQLQLLYCCLVAHEEDWHHNYFCSTALIDYHEKLQNTEPSGSIWDAATKLPYEEILELQERVRNFSDEDRWYFTRAINIFISF